MRKQILIFGHNYATQFIDVYNQYIRLFSPLLYDVTLVILTGIERAEIRQRLLTKEVIFLNMAKKKIRRLKISPIKKLLKLCKEKNFEIVICHRYKPTYIMLWVALFQKIPAIYFVMHELKTMKLLGRQLMVAALKRKNMLFAGVSNAVRDDMRKNLWPVAEERIVTLYNMIDFNLVEPHLLSREQARAELNLNPHDFVFGNIARLTQNKDHQHLILAFAQIVTCSQDAKLIIMGEGELKTKLLQQVQSAGLSHYINFMGFIPGAFRYMKAFDCFILSSTQEAFGRVLLEAMIAKTPIIASKVDGIPEVVSHHGILVNPRDTDGFAKAMQQIYFLPKNEREQIGEKAYQYISKNYSIPTFRKQFWQTYSLFTSG